MRLFGKGDVYKVFNTHKSRVCINMQFIIVLT